MSGLALSLVVIGVFCGAMLLAVPVAFALMAAAVAGLLAQGRSRSSAASTTCCCWRFRSSCWPAT